jgi:hypothetical protein
MQQSIEELSEEVNCVSNPINQLNSRLPLSVQNAGLGRSEVRTKALTKRLFCLRMIYPYLLSSVEVQYRHTAISKFIYWQLHITFFYEAVSVCYVEHVRLLYSFLTTDI